MSNALHTWVTAQREDCLRVEPLAGDAGFRRYHRVFCEHKTFIAVDASHEKATNQEFAKIAQGFLACGLNVPVILASDFEQGYLLLSDFGDTLYLKALTQPCVVSAFSERLYQEALRALHNLQGCSLQLPFYDEALLWREMMLFTDWFLVKHLGLTLGSNEERMLLKLYQFLAEKALVQPRVCIHRDYHSRNLMVMGENNPGILDFQDAVMGPITYDCVSLLRDCYIKWPESKTSTWLKRFFEELPLQHQFSFEQFVEWFDWMGVQRHLKAIGIFARLGYRDHKNIYLQDIPRTLSYITDLFPKYPLLQDFKLFLEENVLCKMPSFLPQAVVCD